jgi:phage host-nuclease inhibitor protein Gam
METNLDETHAALMVACAKYTNKVSPLMVAFGLIQEGSNLNQALGAHCQKLKKELDELKKSKIANENGGAIRVCAPGEAAGEDHS